MSDQPFFAPDHKPAPPRAPAHLWVIRKDGRQFDWELRDHGAWGVEVQIYRERAFLDGRRWPTRAMALGEADQAEGGVSTQGRRPHRIVGAFSNFPSCSGATRHVPAPRAPTSRGT
jgi:hypothetical protein